MPKIPVFESSAPLPQPNSGAARAAAAAGDAQGNMLEGAGRAVQAGLNVAQEAQSRRELTDIATGLAQTGADLHAKWEDTLRTADPNDPNYKDLANNFLRDVAEPALDAVGAKATTNDAQAAFTRGAAGLKAELLLKAHQDQAGVSGVNAATSLVTLANKLNGQVYGDPSFYDTGMRLLDLAGAGSVNNGLKMEDWLKVRQSLMENYTKNMFAGMAASGNPAIQAEVDNPKYDDFLSRPEREELATHATAVQRAAKEWADKQDKDQFDTAISTATRSLMQPDGTLHITPDYFKGVLQASMMPGGQKDPAAVRAAMDFGKALQQEEQNGNLIPSDPHVVDNFRQRLLLPSNDPNALTNREVIEARLSKMLSSRDATFFLDGIDKLSKDPAKQLALKQFETFLNGMKPIVAKSSVFGNILNPVEAQRWYQFQYDMTQQFQHAYDTGGNWQGLLDPRDKSYLGQYLPKYTLDQKGAVSAIQGLVTSGPSVVTPPQKPGAPQRKPGESAADYLKRMGGGN